MTETRLQVGIDFSTRWVDVCLLNPENDSPVAQQRFPNSLPGYAGSKLYEVAPHVVIVPKGMIICGQYFVINKAVWESLSPENRTAIMAVGSDVVAFTNDRSAESDKKVLSQEFPKLGIKPMVMSPQENQKLLEKLKPTWAPEIQKNGEAGLKIAEILGVK